MTTRQAINDQTKYDHIFGRVIRDRKLATKTAIWSFICNFGHFLVTYLSFFGHFICEFWSFCLVTYLSLFGHLSLIIWSLI
jgi:hypothetical protein